MINNNKNQLPKYLKDYCWLCKDITEHYLGFDDNLQTITYFCTEHKFVESNELLEITLRAGWNRILYKGETIHVRS